MSSSIIVFITFCIYFSTATTTDDLTDGRKCLNAQNFFAEKNSEFERCTMQNAVTHKFCSNCLELYVNQTRSYKALLATRDTSTTNENRLCADELNEEDHFGILQKHFENSRGIWSTGRCTQCYICDPDTLPANGNITALCTMQVAVLEMKESATRAKSCFDTTKNDICEKCAAVYEAMWAKYKVEKAVTDNQICSDVKDEIEAVRHKWHNNYKCSPSSAGGWSATTFTLLFVVAVAILYGTFRSYRIYRFRREYLSTAMSNNQHAQMEDGGSDTEL